MNSVILTFFGPTKKNFTTFYRFFFGDFRYLQEFTMLGTAGGMYHFRDQIRAGNPTAFFVLNGDVCSDFPLNDLYEFHKSKNGQSEVRYIANIPYTYYAMN